MVAPAQAGFTMVELVMVIVLIGVLAAVAVPRFFRVEDFQERGFFDETLSSIRYAQKLAVATGCSARVNITAAGYSLFRAADVATCNGGTYNTAVTDPSKSGNFSRTAPSGVTFGPAPPYDIVFAPLGNATINGGTADTTITVGGRQFIVRAVTGYVERL